MVGRLATATLLELLVLPAGHAIWRGRQVAGGRGPESGGMGESVP